MQKKLKKYMKYSKNPLGTKLINNLTSSKHFLIATAIKKYLCLASYSLSLFLERKELIEAPLNINFRFYTISVRLKMKLEFIIVDSSLRSE